METETFRIGRGGLLLVLLVLVVGAEVPDCNYIQTVHPGFICRPFDKLTTSSENPGKIFQLDKLGSQEPSKLVVISEGSKDVARSHFHKHEEIARSFPEEDVIHDQTMMEFPDNFWVFSEVVVDSGDMLLDLRGFQKPPQTDPLDMSIEATVMKNVAQLYQHLHSKGYVYPFQDREKAIVYSPGKKRFVWGDLTRVVRMESPVEGPIHSDQLLDFRVFNKTAPLKTYDEAAGLFKLGSILLQMILKRRRLNEFFHNPDGSMDTLRLTIPKDTNVEAAFLIGELMQADPAARMPIPQLFQFLDLLRQNNRPRGLEEDLVLTAGQPMPPSMSLAIRLAHAKVHGTKEDQESIQDEIDRQNQYLKDVPISVWFWIFFGLLVAAVAGGLWLVFLNRGRVVPSTSKHHIDDSSVEHSDLETPNKLQSRNLTA